MDENLQQAILATFSQVFETMFFTFLEPLEVTPTKGEVELGDYVETSISYTGGHTGSFRFYFPMELARNITVNFLGIDEDELEPDQIRDTMAETANMVIGSLLGRLDPAGSARLAIPSAQELKGFSPADLLDDPGLSLFNTEFGTLWTVGSHT